MCGRYYIEPDEEMLPFIEEAGDSPLAERIAETTNHMLVTKGEVRPTNVAPVVATNKIGAQRTFPMVWGFSLPHRTGSLFNARVETAATKPTFRDSWHQRRCAVPASWYFEWEHPIDPTTSKKRTGDKYAIRPARSHLTWLAGLYRLEQRNGMQVPVFTILTTEPSDSVRFIHDRMPVILPAHAIKEWVRPQSDPTRVLPSALTEMRYQRIG